MDAPQLQARMKGLDFYHTISLPYGLTTPGWPTILPLTNLVAKHLQTMPIAGKRVLDIGCRDGLFSFQAERMQAAEVIGIDNDFAPGVIDLLVEALDSKVSFRTQNLFDLRPAAHGQFDVIIFPGVLYHLRYPFWALQVIADMLVPGGMLLLETAIFVDDNARPMLFCPIGNESPYEPTSCTFFNEKGLVQSLESLGLATVTCERLHRVPAPKTLKPSEMPPVDRVVVVCQKRGDETETQRYWRGEPGSFGVPTWQSPQS